VPAVAQEATPTANTLVEGVDFLPSPMPGVPDAFLRAPEPYQSYEGAPGSGSTIRVLSLLFGPPPPNRGDNSYWQDLEGRLGVTWEMNFVPYEQYGERTATTLAGGDLPDLFYVNPEANAPHLYSAVPQGAFTDLTDYLSGDSLQEYPNLAAIDPAVWQNIAVNGRIYGIPKLIPRFDTTGFYRNDWREAVGLEEPTNADEFFALMDAFTIQDPDGDGAPDTWGLGGVAGNWNVINGGYLQRMFRVPNQWRLEADGTLTNAVETDEYRQAVEFCRRLHDAGLYHPDTSAMTFEQEESNLLGGQISLQIQGFATFLGSEGLRGRIKKLDPNAQLDGLVLPGYNGGDGVTFNGGGAYGFTAISVTAGQDPERVRELLRVMDYLMAPFASDEQIFLEYGVEGVHHTVSENGARVLNDLGAKEVGYFGYFPLIWIARPEPQVFYYPDAPGEAEYAQQLASQILERGIDNPVLGLFSETMADKGAELQQLETDRVGAIVAGRADIATLADFVTEWRTRGGDQMRAEFEAQLQA
jgi:putative aldouronate transport system substrate-binding protein